MPAHVPNGVSKKLRFFFPSGAAAFKSNQQFKRNAYATRVRMTVCYIVVPRHFSLEKMGPCEDRLTGSTPLKKDYNTNGSHYVVTEGPRRKEKTQLFILSGPVMTKG